MQLPDLRQIRLCLCRLIGLNRRVTQSQKSFCAIWPGLEQFFPRFGGTHSVTLLQPIPALLNELALDSGLGDSAGAGSSQHGCNGCANQEMLALHSLAHRGASSPVRVKR